MDEPFLTLARNEVLYQMKRLQSHPSLVMISANNEIETALAQNWFRIPADQMEKVKDDYRKLYLDVIMKAIQEVDKGNNRLFVVSSPSNGLESVNENYTAKNPQDPLYGKSSRSRFLLGSMITDCSRRCALLWLY
jgi:beta-mannosidase